MLTRLKASFQLIHRPEPSFSPSKPVPKFKSISPDYRNPHFLCSRRRPRANPPPRRRRPHPGGVRDVVSVLGGSAVLVDLPLADFEAGCSAGCFCRHVALAASVSGAAARSGDVEGAIGARSGGAFAAKD